ncbi:hypothetical protein [Pseudorhodoplanes sinuspersici]|uniref:hypothetical protein n=1 Tax=Pseudorhodoplanes sinuspersici TaxID=1235591 RepID=UPI000FF7E460|nr:hypothetical protein [Pseudorhodoplanes sinuspersici]RKE73632.1 hypothetical protein DFP91_1526 [Pseudorhodoplanes sinuspersici]
MTTKELARSILALNYGELKSVGKDFAEAIKDKDARPKLDTAEEFADLLFDWAEAQT